MADTPAPFGAPDALLHTGLFAVDFLVGGEPAVLQSGGVVSVHGAVVGTLETFDSGGLRGRLSVMSGLQMRVSVPAARALTVTETGTPTAVTESGTPPAVTESGTPTRDTATGSPAAAGTATGSAAADAATGSPAADTATGPPAAGTATGRPTQRAVIARLGDRDQLGGRDQLDAVGGYLRFAISGVTPPVLGVAGENTANVQLQPGEYFFELRHAATLDDAATPIALNRRTHFEARTAR